MMESKEWLSDFFDAFEPWTLNMCIGNRLVWIRCSWIPLNAWNEDDYKGKNNTRSKG